MKTDHAPYIRATSGQIQYAQTPKTETDGRDSVGIHFGLAQSVQPGLNAAQQEPTVGHQSAHQACAFLGPAAYSGLTIHVQRQDRITEFGQLPGLADCKIIPTCPGGRDQNPGPWSGIAAFKGQETLATGLVMGVFKCSGHQGHLGDLHGVE